MNDTDLDLGRTIRGFAAGEKLFGRYTLKTILGRGGMGIVWRAFDEQLERDVALKFLPELIVLDHSALDELKRETKRNLELTHHNIVRIYDFVHEDNTACISMEYIDGPTLSAVRVGREERIFEVDQLEPLIAQACQALDYAHSTPKIAHRDLKPANLMLTSRNQLKIADFGIARSLSDSVSMLSMRASSGTLLYMSPQQLDGERPSPLDDIYSLGSTLYELLTSKPPFFSGAIENQIRTKAPTSIAVRRSELNVGSDKVVPAYWEETIAACLAKDPSQRPASAREVSQRLRLAFQETGTAPPLPAPRPVPTVQLPPRVPWSVQLKELAAKGMRYLPPSAQARPRLAFGVCLGLLFALAVVSITFPKWSPEIFNRKPSAEWARKVAADELAGAFPQGEALRYDSNKIATRREAAGIVDVTISGTAVTQAALYEVLPKDDPAIGLDAKIAEMRKAQERAQVIRERAAIEISPVDEDAFHFVKESTPPGQSLPFRFQFRARREGADWRLDKIVATELEAATGQSGKSIAAFRNPAVLGTDKANRNKEQLSQMIDSYVAEVTKGEKLAIKRLAARGLDPEGKPLFPEGAMPGERFLQTRTAALQADDISSWPKDDLQYAINEVFARHGASFGDKKVAALFSKAEWYRPKTDASSDDIEDSFSDLERQNIATLSATLQARNEEAARQQRAIAAQREQQAAIRQQHAANRAQQERAEKARRDAIGTEIGIGVIRSIIGGFPHR